MLTDCVNSANVDMLVVLLHAGSVNTSLTDASLQGLETLAIKLEQTKMAEVVTNLWLKFH